MTRIFTILLLLIAGLPMAQTVKAFSIPHSYSCKISVLGGTDVDAPSDFGSGRFFAYKDGCKAKIFDISTQTVVYELDLKSLGFSTESSYASLTFYRNLTASDNNWSAIYTDISTITNPYSYTAGIVSGGKMSLLSMGATAYPSLNLDGSNLYIVIEEKDRTDFYLARNNAARSAAKFMQKRPARQIASQPEIWTDYNLAGQRLTEGMVSKNIKLLRR